MKKCCLASLMLVIATGCSAVVSEALTDAGAETPASKQTSISSREHGGISDVLYADSYIEQMVPYDIKAASSGIPFSKLPYLEVVPQGETKPRNEVFAAIGLADDRICDFEPHIMNNVMFLSWKISPSYYVSCMTAYRVEFPDLRIDRFLFQRLADDNNLRNKLKNPNKMIYGVRVLSHRRP